MKGDISYTDNHCQIGQDNIFLYQIIPTIYYITYQNTVFPCTQKGNITLLLSIYSGNTNPHLHRKTLEKATTKKSIYLNRFEKRNNQEKIRRDYG